MSEELPIIVAIVKYLRVDHEYTKRGGWKMPSDEQFEEFKDRAQHEWEQILRIAREDAAARAQAERERDEARAKLSTQEDLDSAYTALAAMYEASRAANDALEREAEAAKTENEQLALTIGALVASVGGQVMIPYKYFVAAGGITIEEDTVNQVVTVRAALAAQEGRA